MSNEEVKGRVCVAGAGGFLASWTVKLLLSKGYAVNGTIRNPADPKYAHLNSLEKSENLKLFKADLLDIDSLRSAIDGCFAVFHVASPVPSSTVPNPEVEVIEPAVKGTLNVLKASVQSGVKRVVFVSSVAALMMNPQWPKNRVMDETCWSDKDYCRTTKNWYHISKTEAEIEAWEFAKNNGIDLVAICPGFILGPILQSTVNASSMFLLKILNEGCECMENINCSIVDVRDVADAVLLAYEEPDAEGRYICTAHKIKLNEFVEKLKSLYPDYNYPKSLTETGDISDYSSEKLQKLGWKFRPLEDTLVDAVESYQKLGLLDKKQVLHPDAHPAKV